MQAFKTQFVRFIPRITLTILSSCDVVEKAWSTINDTDPQPWTADKIVVFTPEISFKSETELSLWTPRSSSLEMQRRVIRFSFETKQFVITTAVGTNLKCVD